MDNERAKCLDYWTNWANDWLLGVYNCLTDCFGAIVGDHCPVN